MLAAFAILAVGESKKGLQVQMVEDAIALGVRHAAINIQMGDVLTDSPTPEDTPLQGSTLSFRASAFREMDSRVSDLTRHGAKVYAILLARATGNAAIDRLILHPSYDPNSPNRLAAFRTSDADGVRVLQGFARELASRYCPRGAHGTISGWIVGNEVDSHDAWFSMGSASGAEVANVVEKSLRTVYEAVSPYGGSVFLSLDHFWTGKFMPNRPDRCMSGKEVIDRVAEIARLKGDFPWHVAYHPYPENLFEPRFWQDTTAPLSFDAYRVTFKNLEVLTEYLKRPNLQYRGRSRRVILSEQGFHRPDGPDGETTQAAAYAYAWNRVVRNPGIDAFILHRHVDHAQEGGLRLGLWTNKPGSIADPERRTRMWEVFRAAGTSDESKVMAFALPLVGLRRWEDAKPKPVR